MNAKNLRKILSVILTLCILVSLPVGVSAQAISDEGITPYYLPCPGCGTNYAEVVIRVQGLSTIHHQSTEPCIDGFNHNDLVTYNDTTEYLGCSSCQYPMGSRPGYRFAHRSHLF